MRLLPVFVLKQPKMAFYKPSAGAVLMMVSTVVVAINASMLKVKYSM
ncbi:MAG: hypothetical protein JWQ25_272 [Daejeonella sp.]|nr:hypothetical protein [Daejeonella sp.]